jgi:hypothetical protein
VVRAGARHRSDHLIGASPLTMQHVRREQRLKHVIHEMQGNLSANRRSPASVPSAFSSAANWATFIGHGAILSPIEAGVPGGGGLRL